LSGAGSLPAEPARAPAGLPDHIPHVTSLLDNEKLIEANAAPLDDKPIGDLTREALEFPADRDLRLQGLARGDEGFLLGLAYSTQRGFGRTHPFAGEVRIGEVEVELFAEELGFAVPLGEITVTEFETVNQFTGTDTAPPQFTRGYGLVFGHCERRAMSMALVDRALRAAELGEDASAPAQDAEFVLSHCDNVAATGFVEHLKLPHYVDFQAELGLIRKLRKEHLKEDATRDSRLGTRKPESDTAPISESRIPSPEFRP
jgi:alpha-D-ribose 1-methylphosphonate 5-triphosphate synthase subunit PhnI